MGHYAYECPNKKAMILRDGEYISDSEVKKGERVGGRHTEREKTNGPL